MPSPTLVDALPILPSRLDAHYEQLREGVRISPNGAFDQKYVSNLGE